MKKVVLIKFGGSIMVPEFPDAEYIKQFYDFINKLNHDFRFILVVGGGGINKKYNEIAQNIVEVNHAGLDWIGVYATRLNARLLVSVFGKKCHPKVITNPTAQINWKKDILVGAGWKPGWSTDYDSVILAHRFEAEKVIVATNTDYVFDKDPNKHDDAKPLKHIEWQELRKMIGEEWTPRMHIPLDPSAIRYAQEKAMTVFSLNGKNLDNIEKAIKGEEFKGTIIS